MNDEMFNFNNEEVFSRKQEIKSMIIIYGVIVLFMIIFVFPWFIGLYNILKVIFF